MNTIMTSRFSSPLSIVLIIVMCLWIVIPVYGAETTKTNPMVINTLGGDYKINVGKGEGVRVGATGVISRYGRDLAKFQVTGVDWGESKISVSDVTSGVVALGDNIRFTSPLGSPEEKKVGKNSSKALWVLLAVGIIVALASGRGHSSSPAAPPASSQVTLITERSSIPVSGSTTITAEVKDANSVAVPDGTQVAFSTTLGTVVPSTAQTVNGRASTALTAGSSAGTATVSATSGGKTGTIPVAIVSGGTPTIDLAAGPQSIQVIGSGGDHTQSTITATCRDAAGNLANGGTVTFTSTIGSVVGTATIDAIGVATTTFSSSVTGVANIKATWSGTEATTTVTVTAGPPYSVIIDCIPSSIQCDRNSFATVKAAVRDIAGNPVTDGTVVSFATKPDVNGGGNGTLSIPQAPTAGGEASVVIYSRTAANDVSKPGTATLTAQVLTTGQPAGIPIPASNLGSHGTYLQFITLEISELHVSSGPVPLCPWSVVGTSGSITAVVYDANHNPVPDGTAVYFTADYGLIYGNAGSAGRVSVSTTMNGQATATLVSDGVIPVGGIVTVTATAGPKTATCSVSVQALCP